MLGKVREEWIRLNVYTEVHTGTDSTKGIAPGKREDEEAIILMEALGELWARQVR